MRIRVMRGLGVVDGLEESQFLIYTKLLLAISFEAIWYELETKLPSDQGHRYH